MRMSQNRSLPGSSAAGPLYRSLLSHLRQLAQKFLFASVRPIPVAPPRILGVVQPPPAAGLGFQTDRPPFQKGGDEPLGFLTRADFAVVNLRQVAREPRRRLEGKSLRPADVIRDQIPVRVLAQGP
jgi:hypothetical protein